MSTKLSLSKADRGALIVGIFKVSLDCPLKTGSSKVFTEIIKLQPDLISSPFKSDPRSLLTSLVKVLLRAVT